MIKSQKTAGVPLARGIALLIGGTVPPAPCRRVRHFAYARARSTASIDTRDHGAVRSRKPR